MKVWHEDGDFWRTMAPYLFAKRRWEDAPTEIDGVLQLKDVIPGSRVLDLCCGLGRHALGLARRGFRVTAVDRNAEYLAQARAQAEKGGLEVEFVQEDMRRFRRSSAFTWPSTSTIPSATLRIPRKIGRLLKICMRR